MLITFNLRSGGRALIPVDTVEAITENHDGVVVHTRAGQELVVDESWETLTKIYSQAYYLLTGPFINMEGEFVDPLDDKDSGSRFDPDSLGPSDN